MEPTERIDELFAGPLEEFTAGREEFVKALRTEGRRHEAAQVARLRRPTRAATDGIDERYSPATPERTRR